MEITKAESIQIRKHDLKSVNAPNIEGADYVICQVDVQDTEKSRELLSSGFAFLDRILLFEIGLANVQLNGTGALKDISVTCDTEYIPEMNEIAHKAFIADRRFHLNHEFDLEKAAPIMDAYINRCKEQEMKIYKALHGTELLGFTIVNEKADPKGICFENMLGATMPGIKGKMIAPMLYKSMLCGEKDSFKKCLGRVSSSNLASLNLHIQLGGKVSGIYDEYIYRSDMQK